MGTLLLIRILLADSRWRRATNASHARQFLFQWQMPSAGVDLPFPSLIITLVIHMGRV